MESVNEIDMKDVCRICTSSSGRVAVYPLLDGGQITALGEIFEICIGLQLRKDGFPDRLCNYCQLQLSMFHAFLKEAERSNNSFEEILGGTQNDGLEEQPPDQDSKGQQYIEMQADSDDELEYILEEAFKSPKIEIPNESSEEQSIVHELIVPDDANATEQLELNEQYSANDGNDSEYSVEYLDFDEFGANFENDIDDDVIANANRNDDVENDKSVEMDVPTMVSVKSSTKRVTGAKLKRSYPYRCKICSRRFMYKEVYDAHMRVHRGLPAFACPHCPKTFSEKANYDYHMQDHTNYRPAKCTMCEKSFKNKQDLASHIRCHKDIRKYMCDVCGKRFRSQSHMVYHRYSHFEERNFHCDLCTQSFKSPHILRTHRNTVHSKIFRYECEECGRKFKRDHHLIAHRGVHLRAKMKNIKKEIQE